MFSSIVQMMLSTNFLSGDDDFTTKGWVVSFCNHKISHAPSISSLGLLFKVSDGANKSHAQNTPKIQKRVQLLQAILDVIR
jgi:hypothetical protein